MIMLFDLFSFRWIREASPASVDFRGLDFLCHRGGSKARLGGFDFRRVHEKLVADLAGEFRTVLTRPIPIRLAHQLKSLNAAFRAF